MKVLQSQATVGHNEGGTINTIFFSVALQFRNATMGAGAHTVVVETMRECNGYIDNCVLLVQTYTYLFFFYVLYFNFANVK